MSYRSQPTAATTLADLRSWANRELQRITLAFDQARSEVILSPLSQAPAKPQPGQLVFADGTNWNPGSGRGLYYYDSGWVFIA